MSEPTERYEPCYYGDMRYAKDGAWVEYADYARLKAEVERLKAEKDQAECDYDNCQKRKVSIDNHRFDLFTENKTLKAEKDEETRATFEAIRALQQARDEVERLKEGNECLGQMHDKEMERSAYLCEQVERLEKGIQPEGSNDAVGRAVELLLEKEKEIANLKAEVERLRKAGDAMAYATEQNGCHDNGCYEQNEEAMRLWNEAKEGKPTE